MYNIDLAGLTHSQNEQLRQLMREEISVFSVSNKKYWVCEDSSNENQSEGRSTSLTELQLNSKTALK